MPNSISPWDRDNKGLLKGPKNTTTKRLFIAGTRMNEGKTTASLGLFEALRATGLRIGYIKPVGQRVINVNGNKIDEDTILVNEVYKVQVPIEAMSPVAVDGSFTRDYLDDPQTIRPQLIDSICRAFDRTAYEKDIVIIEGSGHAGVGSVFDLSNAQVAKLLDAKAIIVSSGGIGRPVDEIAMNKALFDNCGVPLIGAIINKVKSDKMDMIRKYASKALSFHGVPLLGILPVRTQLERPSLTQIIHETNAQWICGEQFSTNETIYDVVITARNARSILSYFKRGTLFITPSEREDVIFAAVAAAGISNERIISGMILSGKELPHPNIIQMLKRTDIPVAMVDTDSYELTTQINSITAKTQPTDHDKIPIIQEIFRDNINLSLLLEQL